MPSNARRLIWLRRRPRAASWHPQCAARRGTGGHIMGFMGLCMLHPNQREAAMSARLPVLLITLGAVLAATAAAEARTDSRGMSCTEIRAMIQSRRAVVLTTGPDTYDRYVRQFGNECDWPEVPMSAYIPARDGHCPVYRCQEPVDNFPN